MHSQNSILKSTVRWSHVGRAPFSSKDRFEDPVVHLCAADWPSLRKPPLWQRSRRLDWLGPHGYGEVECHRLRWLWSYLIPLTVVGYQSLYTMEHLPPDSHWLTLANNLYIQQNTFVIIITLPSPPTIKSKQYWIMLSSSGIRWNQEISHFGKGSWFNFSFNAFTSFPSQICRSSISATVPKSLRQRT